MALRERWEVVPGSAGGFLDPPGFPTHGFEVRGYYNGNINRTRDADAYCAVTSPLAEPENYPAHIVKRCQEMVDNWHAQKPNPHTDAGCQAWVGLCQ
jgi:hypothetical protein